MIRCSAIPIFAEAYREAYELAETDVFLWSQPLDKVGGIRAFAPAFYLGATTVYFNGFVFANNFFDAVGKYSITVINLQPFALNMLLRGNLDGFCKYADQIDKVIVGGSILPEKIKLMMRGILPNSRLFFHYNSTEIAPISYLEYTQGNLYPNCVGRPFPCTQVRVLDENGIAVKVSSKDKTGIIECQNDGVMLGYWKDNALTREVLSGNRIKMTDIGYLDNEGLLYVLGRRDDVIITGGHKVAPYEIEEAVLELDGILEAACVPYPDRTMGNIPKLLVVLNKNCRLTGNDIEEFLTKRLDKYKLPKIITCVETLPKIKNGYQKIDRKELLKYD
jgi:long-chain acyl-CoA synthetase